MRLGDVFTISSGGTPNKNEPAYYENGTIPWVKTGDLKSKYVSDEIEYITELGLKNSSAKLFPCGTVLIAMYGATIGACSILPYEASTNQACAAFLPNGTVLQEYLYYFLSSHKDKFVNDGVGGAQPNISAGYLKNVEFEIIPISEQQEIIDALEKVDTLISLRKQQLAKLDELVQARFVELFGNGHDGKTSVKMLGSICKFQQGTQIPVEEQFEEQIAGYKRFLRIIDYTQAPQPPRYVNVNGKEVDEKSVVIVRYGATAGFVGRGYQGILANNLFEIMPDETILSKEFLFLALKYGTFEKEVHDKAFGAAMPALSFSMMNDIPVVVPMPEQQSQFVAFVEQTDKSKSAIQQSLEKLETLKAALMQKYFG